MCVELEEQEARTQKFIVSMSRHYFQSKKEHFLSVDFCSVSCFFNFFINEFLVT